MNRIFPKLLALAAPVLFFAFNLSAQESSAKPELSDAEKAKLIDETVALGRAYMGDDAALDAVNSIRLEGVLVHAGGQSGTVESVVVKPGYYQFISTIAGVRETSTLNPTSAWRKVEDFKNPGSYSMSFYGLDEMRLLQATIADNLGFLKAPTTRNGRIVYIGKGKVRGKSAIVLDYVYDDHNWFRRFFDPETGRVMYMQSSKGAVFSYEGELEVAGVRFPQKVIVTYISQYGESTMEISYSNAEINLDVDLERFRVPQVGE